MQRKNVRAALTWNPGSPDREGGGKSFQSCLLFRNKEAWGPPSPRDVNPGILFSCCYSELSILNNTKLLSNNNNTLGGQSLKMVLTGLESRCLQGCIPSGGSGVQFGFLPFPASGGTCTPWLTAPSSIFKARSTASSNLSLFASASITSSPPRFPSLTLLPCRCRDTYAYIGPMQISQAHLPISGSLAQSHLQK